MFRSMMTITGFTLMSRVLGFLRDSCCAAYLGTTGIADAFFSAFRFPNLGRRVFGEGAFNSAFVPLYSHSIESKSEEEASRFASQAFSWLLAILCILSLIIIPFMRWFIAPLVPGFLDGFDELGRVGWWAGFRDGSIASWLWSQLLDPRGGEEFERTVSLAKVMFPYLLCMALSAQLGAVLNTWKKFAMAAFAPVLLNIIFLLGFVYIWLFGLGDQTSQVALVLSWCVFAAGWAQLAVLYIGVKRQKLRICPMIPRVTSQITQLGKLMIPGIAAASVQQINLIVGMQIASAQKGAISAINYADRVNQLPLGMFGIALGVVLLPEISRKIGKGDLDGANESLNQGVKIAMLLTLPAALAMMVIPYDIVRALFQRVNFDAQSTIDTGRALAAFAIGMPAYVLIRVLQPGYFARKDTKTPMKFGAIMVTVNIIVSFILFPRIGHVGLALATSLAGWVNVLLLLFGLKSFFRFNRGLLTSIALILLSSTLMGGVVWGTSSLCQDWLDGSQLRRFTSLFLIVGLGAAVYALFVLLLKATSLRELKLYMKK